MGAVVKRLTAALRVAGSIPLRVRGVRSNKTPRTFGQLKEHTGFLVSRSLTLPAAQPPDEQKE